MKINPFIIPVILVSAIFGFMDEYLLMFLALLLHEAAHLLAVKSSQVEIEALSLEPFGMKITLKEEILKNPADEIKIAAAGPLFSLLCGVICLFLKPFYSFFDLFLLPNIYIGIFNLLPIFPSDGGRIARAYLSLKTGYIKSYNAVKKITGIFSAFLIISGIFVFFITGFNFSLCLAGSFLFYNLLCEKNHTAYYIQKELNGYSEKNSEFERMDILRIAVNENYPARKILKELTLSRYCIAEVFRGHKKLCEFTEGELMDAIIKHGTGITVKDIYKSGNIW